MKFLFLPAIILTLGLLAAIVPQFTDCASDGKSITLANGKTIPMKCHWSARAEIAVGVPILGIGLGSAFSRRKETVRTLSMLGVLLGALVILVPTTLIGVCGTPGMTCNTTLRPAMIAVGSLVIAASLCMLAYNEFQGRAEM